jgi:hypothetical protein
MIYQREGDCNFRIMTKEEIAADPRPAVPPQAGKCYWTRMGMKACKGRRSDEPGMEYPWVFKVNHPTYLNTNNYVAYKDNGRAMFDDRNDWNDLVEERIIPPVLCPHCGKEI